jgi:hypothetical protein
LKAPQEGVEDAVREALRAEVKALELKAEQVLMTKLEAMAPPSAGTSLPLNDALIAAAEAWAFTAPKTALAKLAKALS